jgi:uncharacterized iron-regulated membrane protein
MSRWLLLHRIHRIIGVTCAFFTLILAITGLFLLRNETWKLAEHQPPASLVRYLYQLPKPEITGFNVADSWWSYSEQSLWLKKKLTLQNLSQPLAISPKPFGTLIITSDEIIMLDHEQNLIDRMKLAQDIALSPPLTQFKIEAEALFLQSKEGSLKSRDYLNWETTGPFSTSATTPTAKLPNELHAWIANQTLPTSLSWERLLLDLHSGRILGSLGPWIMEISAWGLILLVITGLWLQAQRSRLKYQRKTTN